MSDPRIGSVDVETYGICKVNSKGVLLPNQTVFNPRRSMFTDKCPRNDLIQTISITLPKVDVPRPLGADAIATLVPGETMVFKNWIPEHRKMVAHWLRHFDTIVGMNLGFDLQYLRMYPEYACVLTGKHLLLDVSVMNYLHSEVRPERSLKTIGPLLGLYAYEWEARENRVKGYETPDDPKLLSYNGADTHNSLLAVVELARLCLKDYPDTDKLSWFCLQMFSESLWVAVRMAESGIPMSRKMLAALEAKHLAIADKAFEECKTEGLLISGEGSEAPKRSFMRQVFDEIDATLHPHDETFDAAGVRKKTVPEVVLNCRSVYDMVELTEKTREISITELNRKLAVLMIRECEKYRPELAHLRGVFDAWDENQTAQSTVSSYTYPLLRHRRKKSSAKSQYDSIIIPDKGDFGLAYPTWYVVPTSAKDSSGESGGQKQGRFSAKGPGASKFPPSIKACIQSRFGREGRICSYDLSQIELRTAGLTSGDESLLTNYREGRDLHSDRTVYVFGQDILNDPNFGNGDGSVDPRQWCKKFNFEDLYWAGPDKMQMILLQESGVLLPLDFFIKVVRSRPFLRPGLWEWQNALVREAEEKGYLSVPFTGQTRKFVGGKGANKPNEMVNFPIQTIAANVTVRVQALLHRRLPSLNAIRPLIHLCQNTYDSNTFDCHESQIPALQQMIAETVHYVETEEYWAWLQNHYGREVPLKYDFKIHKAAA